MYIFLHIHIHKKKYIFKNTLLFLPHFIIEHSCLLFLIESDWQFFGRIYPATYERVQGALIYLCSILEIETKPLTFITALPWPLARVLNVFSLTAQLHKLIDQKQKGNGRRNRNHCDPYLDPDRHAFFLWLTICCYGILI